MRVAVRHMLRRRQTRQRNQRQDPESDPASEAERESDHQRRKNIILLLDAQRPCMNERVGLHVGREVTDLAIEVYIRAKQCGRDHAFGEVPQFIWIQQDECGQRGRKDDQIKRWKDAADAAFIKCGKGEIAGLLFLSDNAGNQVPADDKENIDAEKARTQPCRPGMRQDDRHDRNSPQAVYFSSVF